MRWLATLCDGAPRTTSTTAQASSARSAPPPALSARRGACWTFLSAPVARATIASHPCAQPARQAPSRRTAATATVHPVAPTVSLPSLPAPARLRASARPASRSLPALASPYSARASRPSSCQGSLRAVSAPSASQSKQTATVRRVLMAPSRTLWQTPPARPVAHTPSQHPPAPTAHIAHALPASSLSYGTDLMSWAARVSHSAGRETNACMASAWPAAEATTTT